MKTILLLLILTGTIFASVIDPNDVSVISVDGTKITRISDPNTIEEINYQVRTYTVRDLLKQRRILQRKIDKIDKLLRIIKARKK